MGLNNLPVDLYICYKFAYGFYFNQKINSLKGGNNSLPISL